MDWQRFFSLNNQPPPRVGYRGRMIMALFDIGGERAAHDGDKTFIRDGFQTIPTDF